MRLFQNATKSFHDKMTCNPEPQNQLPADFFPFSASNTRGPKLTTEGLLNLDLIIFFQLRRGSSLAAELPPRISLDQDSVSFPVTLQPTFTSSVIL